MASPSEARHYKVLDVLGRGGFGTVYRAELHDAEGFQKLVALKVLREEVQAQTAALARLRDEARLLGRLQHRAIVQVDGLVQLDGRWAVVMEFVEGVSLKDVLGRHGPMPVPVALQVVAEVASALDSAYALATADEQPLRLLHRDVKPSNVQIGSTGAVKLLDFGVARGELEGGDAHARGLVYGSVPYLAPERLALVDTHRGDVYALGVTLLELLGERLPPAQGPDAADHAHRLATPLDRLRELGGAALADLVGSALAYDPASRPDASAFEQACRALRSGLGGPDLADWARETVQLLVDTREIESGELSGVTLGEQVPTASTTLSGLLRAAPTWDEHEESAPARPDSSAAPERVGRRWVFPAIVGSLALGGFAVVGLAVVTAFAVLALVAFGSLLP